MQTLIEFKNNFLPQPGPSVKWFMTKICSIKLHERTWKGNRLLLFHYRPQTKFGAR